MGEGTRLAAAALAGLAAGWVLHRALASDRRHREAERRRRDRVSLSLWPRDRLLHYVAEQVGPPGEASEEDLRRVVAGLLEEPGGSVEQETLLNLSRAVLALATAQPAAVPAHRPAASVHSPPVVDGQPGGSAEHPQVVLSYQSLDLPFMCKLRDWLNTKGVATVDGTQVPPGSDWRQFYFSALRKGCVLLPILSRTFVYSRACESELTFAADRGKVIIPILLDPTYLDVLDCPEQFSSECEDIELRAPKFEALLSCCNRIPASPSEPFYANEAAFEHNAQVLLKHIRAALASKSRQSAARSSHAVGLVRVKSMGEQCAARVQQAHGANRGVKLLSCLQEDARPPEMVDFALSELQDWLWDDEKDWTRDEHCEQLIQAGPIPAIMQILNLDASPGEIGWQIKALDCVRSLLLAGPSYGPGLLGFRDTANEAGMSKRLLQLLSFQSGQASCLAAHTGTAAAVTEASQQREHKHMILVVLRGMSKSKSGKVAIGSQDGIQTMIGVLTQEGSTEEGRTVAVQVLRGLVFLSEHKAQMLEAGILAHLSEFLKTKRSSQAESAAYFVCSHLASTYPEAVGATDLAQAALKTISTTEPPFDSYKSHCLEGACRLIATLAKPESSCERSLYRAFGDDCLQAMLSALLFEDRSEDLHVSASDKKVATHTSWDSFKLRSSEAAGYLIKWIPSSLAVCGQFLDLLSQGQRRHLAWLAMHPSILALYQERSPLYSVGFDCVESVDDVLVQIGLLKTACAIKNMLDSTNKHGRKLSSYLAELIRPGITDCPIESPRWSLLALVLQELIRDAASEAELGALCTLLLELGVVSHMAAWIKEVTIPYKYFAGDLLKLMLSEERSNPERELLECELSAMLCGAEGEGTQDAKALASKIDQFALAVG